MKKRRAGGFALIAAVMANLVLMAVGIIAVNLSTQDLRVSMKIVGDKKAMGAAEAATHWVLLNFDPANPGAVAMEKRPATELSAGLDPRTRITITQPVAAATGPRQVNLSGYDMASTPWVLVRYDTTVTGRNEDYQTSMTIEAGLGYGPVSAESYR